MNPAGSGPARSPGYPGSRARSPHELALRTVGGAVTITWGDYVGRVRQIAAGLAGLGVGPGDTVALMMTNRPEFARTGRVSAAGTWRALPPHRGRVPAPLAIDGSRAPGPGSGMGSSVREVIAVALRVASSANPAQAASAGLNPAVTLAGVPRRP